MFNRQQLIKRFFNLIKLIILMLFILIYPLNRDYVYAQNITIKFFSDNSLVKVDSILRIDKGIEARLYNYKTDQSSNLPTESQLLNAGLEQSINDNFEEAVKLYTKALQFNPSFTKAYVSRAYSRSQLEHIKEAFKDYNKALKIDPNLVDAYIGRGNLHFQKGNNQEAIKDFESAININKNYYDAYFGRGSVNLKLNKYKEAISDFSEAISLNPQYIDAYIQRGYAKSYFKDYKGVVEDSTKAINLDLKKQEYTAYNNRGLALFYLGKNQDALKDINQSLKINPDFPIAHYNRGLVSEDLGKYRDAISSYDKALNYKIDDYQSWTGRGFSLSKLAKYNEAVSSYEQALHYKPDYYEAWRKRGIALTQLRKYKEAIDSYNQALKYHPNDDISLYYKACTYGLQGRLSLAVKHLEKAIKLNPEYKQKAKTNKDFDSIRKYRNFQRLLNS